MNNIVKNTVTVDRNLLILGRLVSGEHHEYMTYSHNKNEFNVQLKLN